MTDDLGFQPTLFDGGAPGFDRSFAGLRRIALDEASWVDHAPGWVSGSDRLFLEVLRACRWDQRSRWMYERELAEPRLTAPWELSSGAPLLPPLVDEMRRCLSARYGVLFDSAGFNLYRDGRDGVAWHADRIRPEVAAPVVVLVSLGEPRRFLLRPRGGGRSLAFRLGRGDLLVTGGEAQRAWEHAVPKVARAGPRVSIAFRHGLDPSVYGRPIPPPAPGDAP
ncbi:alpha-ketoglutarate-dependent dioxygenase AlkB [Anaeromyxobacter paludicola]|uniref:Alkylated DNA repair protein n=1 Tax=Anaeromyxobacter paludicola TaxID=2918171 RepID=A0ABN6NBF1_9BACT|nr:alpha-ketoglutarate-dependent dioxygenase AlkB [Anaeromyxobacter paludicola]BDG10556.1 alkylated DNA repair protein [Anaeromyxobacter paludicola]